MQRRGIPPINDRSLKRKGALPPNHPDRANIVPLNLYAGTSLHEIQQHAICFAPEVLADAGLPQVLRGVTGVDNLLPIAQPMPDNVFLRHLRSMINRRVNIAPPKLDQDTLTWLKREHPDDDKLHHLSLMTPPSHEPPKSFADLKPLPPPSIDEQVKLYQEAQRVLAEAKAANKPATAPATDNLDSRTGTPPQPEPQPTPPLAENQPKVYSAKEIQELSQTLDQVSEVALAQFEKKHDLLGIFQIALMKTKVGPEVALGLLQNLDRIKGIPTELAPTIGELTAYLEQQISAQPTSPLLEAAQRSHLLTADQIRDLNDPARRGEAMDEIIQTVKEHRGDTTALQSFFKDENIFGADFKYGLDTIFAKAGSNIRNTKDIKKFIAEWQKLEQGAMEYYKNEAIHGTQKGIEKSISGIFALFLALSMVQGLTGDQPQGGHQ